jgi:hypothetical protein
MTGTVEKAESCRRWMPAAARIFKVQFRQLQELDFALCVMATRALLVSCLLAPMFQIADALQPAATCATTPLKFQQAIAKDAFRGGLEPAGEGSMHHY